jgi:hypothetical protein
LQTRLPRLAAFGRVEKDLLQALTLAASAKPCKCLALIIERINYPFA